MHEEVLGHWCLEDKWEITPIEVGLLNKTYLVGGAKSRFILQRMNPAFHSDVNYDIDALTQHLEKRGVPTPRLVKTSTGGLCVNYDSSVWRLFTFREGVTYSSLSSKNLASRAGKIVARFHISLTDFDHRYLFSRPNPHDTHSHMQRLVGAIERYPNHHYFSKVTKIAQKILKSALKLPDFSSLQLRHSHGDLKISNLLFTEDFKQSSLIDFDTIGLQTWPLEMGDAFRSWCNPKGEDSLEAFFDENLFEASLSAYAKMGKRLWSKEEVDALIDGIQTIPLELASRFLRDVLEDSYFGYDANKFESRSDHNLVRALGQLSLYCDIENKKARLQSIIDKAFA